jgi:hypothetical protein
LQCTHHFGLALGALELGDLGRAGGSVHGNGTCVGGSASLGESAAAMLKKLASPCAGDSLMQVKNAGS